MRRGVIDADCFGNRILADPNDARRAAAAPLAALMLERERVANRTVGLIMTGGNIERARLMQVFGGATPQAN